jgi:hypothetical protein
MAKIKRIPLAEYAKQEGKAYQTVRDKVVRGTLKGEKIKGTWHVIVDDSIEVEAQREAQPEELNTHEKPIETLALKAQHELNVSLKEQVESYKNLLEALGNERQGELKRIESSTHSMERRTGLLFIVSTVLLIGGLFVGWIVRNNEAERTITQHQKELETIESILDDQKEVYQQTIKSSNERWTTQLTQLITVSANQTKSLKKDLDQVRSKHDADKSKMMALEVQLRLSLEKIKAIEETNKATLATTKGEVDKLSLELKEAQEKANSSQTELNKALKVDPLKREVKK